MQALPAFGFPINRRRSLAKLGELDESAGMRTYRRATELMEAEIGDELVALQPELGLCFGFNDVATEVWKQLQTPKSFEDIKVHLLAGYDVDDRQCSSDLDELLAQMIERGLIAADSD
jgi:hypothetical protein